MNKKKILKIIIASSAIAGGITLSNSVVYASEGKGRVVNVSSSLNVRAEAGTQYEVITHLKNGQEVEICGEVDWGLVPYSSKWSNRICIRRICTRGSRKNYTSTKYRKFSIGNRTCS